jgi:hypothetical protein
MSRPTTEWPYLETWVSRGDPKPGEPPGPVQLAMKALDLPLSDFGGWQILIQCQGGCERRRREVDPLILSLPPNMTVRQTVRRLRCQCGAPPGYVALTARNSISSLDPYLPVLLPGQDIG